MRFDRQFFSRARFGEGVGFDDQVFAHASAAPVLPAFQTCGLPLCDLDAALHCLVERRFLRKLIDLMQMLNGFTDVSARQRGFGFD